MPPKPVAIRVVGVAALLKARSEELCELMPPKQVAISGTVEGEK
jgi:hypothetical protein